MYECKCFLKDKHGGWWRHLRNLATFTKSNKCLGHKRGVIVNLIVLTLQATAKHFNNASELAETEHFLCWKVADVNLAHEWYQMMFAEGEHFNIAYDNHLIVIFVEYGLVQYVWISFLMNNSVAYKETGKGI